MQKILILITLLLFAGCANMNDGVVTSSKSQVQTRSYQSRIYDTTDRTSVLQSVLATMQDLGFIIEKADSTLGIITGYSSTHISKMSVSIRKRNEKQMIVRVNAQRNNREIEDPIAYQNFFNSLSQSLFLEAHDVN